MTRMESVLFRKDTNNDHLLQNKRMQRHCSTVGLQRGQVSAIIHLRPLSSGMSTIMTV